MSKNSRRQFIQKSALGATAISALGCTSAASEKKNSWTPSKDPIVISTWNFGQQANAAAWDVLGAGGYALDAVEAGVRQSEADESNHSVGIGGFPDRDGHVTLDACIMNEKGNCGSVAAIQDILHPITVARQVMEDSPHVMIVGEGATQFALDNGHKRVNLLTPKAEEHWKKWLETSEYKPIINIENHDTIGMLALDHNSDLCGACTTSGLAYKLHGRVGDSPIIGSGLFVDNEIGAAVATGLGEEVIKIVGGHLVVELMRQGYTPDEACREAVNRIVKKQGGKDPDFQIAFLALRKDGQHAGYSIHPGFNYAVRTSSVDELIDAESYL